jgi:hypothetical protein
VGSVSVEGLARLAALLPRAHGTGRTPGTAGQTRADRLSYASGSC